MENLKTLWQLLQEVIENDWDNWYSLHEFLLESSEEDRKRIEEKLTETDMKQFYEYMDWFTFVNSEEVYNAVCEYYEKVNNRPLCMGEMGDMSEVAEDYIREKNLNFDEEEFDAREDENAFLDSCDEEDFEDMDVLMEKYMTFTF